jgi:hypothetical protein
MACAAIEIPSMIRATLDKFPDLVPDCRMLPSVLVADFDGDGRKDYAVLVANHHSKQRGLIVVFGSGRTVVAGAGHLVPYGPGRYADLNFDAWEVYPKGRRVEHSNDQKSLTLRGDALLVSYHEGASGLFYWTGKQFGWYQQGD